MLTWFHFVEIILFGILGIIFIIGGGLFISIIYSVRNSPSEGYKIASISFIIGMVWIGIAISFLFENMLFIIYSIMAGLIAGLPLWLMSYLVNLPLQKQARLYFALMVFVLFVFAILWFSSR